MSLIRFTVARGLIRIALRIMPEGRVRDEIHDMLGVWGYRVRIAISGDAHDHPQRH